ncbi:hydroxymethylpyrimidine/phosphomethylpyrimidine kinase [Shimia sp.]|uniref:bifunctional hydroxymethylpyrimidine kinase/phosphomethylpyrimidine kinase n=1 Tax=Shimia sp. TaxID=1954381 RepID=UPI003297B10D
MKRVLLIGGTDSSGGAGLTRDCAVAHDLACFAKPVVTCVTAQTNSAVSAIHEMPASVIGSQIMAAFEDTPPDAVKIGMTGSQSATNAIADALTNRRVPVVLDPVLRASSGGTLGDSAALKCLFTIADIVTPNLDEAAILSNRPIADCEHDLALQAQELCAQGARVVLIKGGHGQGDMCCDHLFDTVGACRFCLPRLRQNKRGTGCSLATAVACHMANGQDTREACRNAKDYLHRWIAE